MKNEPNGINQNQNGETLVRVNKNNFVQSTPSSPGREPNTQLVEANNVILKKPMPKSQNPSRGSSPIVPQSQTENKK